MIFALWGRAHYRNMRLSLGTDDREFCGKDREKAQVLGICEGKDV